MNHKTLFVAGNIIIIIISSWQAPAAGEIFFFFFGIKLTFFFTGTTIIDIKTKGMGVTAL